MKPVHNVNGRLRPALKIAVTGFGPFPGMPFNASERLIHDLQAAHLRAIPRPNLFTAVLPTDWRQAVPQLRDLLQSVKPDIALHFGVSHRARGFVIETRAVNQTCARQDCTGAKPSNRCVRGSTAPALNATLPAARLVQRLRMEGVPARLSRDAGRYLCNTVLYESLHAAETAGLSCLTGFIHVPALRPPDHDAAPGDGFGWQSLIKGAVIILETLARVAKADQGWLLGSGRPCSSER